MKRPPKFRPATTTDPTFEHPASSCRPLHASNVRQARRKRPSVGSSVVGHADKRGVQRVDDQDKLELTLTMEEFREDRGREQALGVCGNVSSVTWSGTVD